MNILYVHRTQGKGVEGVHIMGVVDSFRKMGHTVDILSPTSARGSGAGPPRKSGMLTYLASHAPEIAFEMMELGYNFILKKRMADMFKAKNYSFVYERTALLNYASVDFCAARNIPIFLEVNFTADMPLVRKRSAILSPLANFVDQKILRGSSHNFPVSNYLKDHMVKRGIPADKITVLTNAADPEIFRPGVSGEAVRQKYHLEGKTVIGFVGGFYPWHGLQLLVNAMELAVQSAPSLSALLIGDGPMRPELERMIREKKLENYFHFTGKVVHDELPNFTAAIDLGVMPDSNEYGSPMKIFEYMAMEKPVVAADYGPLRDGIDPDVHGKLFKPQSVSEFARCLVEMANEPEKRKQMGKNGRERIVKDRNWLNQSKKIIEIYENIMQNSNRWSS